MISAHLSAAVNKIKDAALMSHGVLGKPRTLLHPTKPRKIVQLVLLAYLEVVVLVLICDDCRGLEGPAEGGAESPSLLLCPSPLAGPTKKVKPANPSSSLLPHRAHRLVD